MRNRYTYSGDRNRYFTGKLMTARDFEAEQRYMNDRRRLGNRLLHGMGVVSGLNVLLLDGQTFSLEAGMAVDALGREVVVEEPCTKRLSVLDGFASCRDTAWLCLRYREEPREETFSAEAAATGALEPEHNSIHEGYELYLTPEAPEPGAVGLAELKECTLILYRGDGMKLSLCLARHVGPGGILRGTVRFEKRGQDAPSHYRFTLSGDLFSAPEGGALEVKFDETEVASSCREEREVALRCTAGAAAPATLRIGEIAVRCGTVEAAPPDRECEVTITEHSAAEAVIGAYFSRGFDCEEIDTPLCLARFELISDATAYYIERVENNPLRQYLASTALLQLLQTLPPEREQAASAGVAAPPVPLSGQEPEVRLATGVETIDLGFAAKAGKEYFSDELVHGLGSGRVAVVAALENAPGSVSGEEELLLFGESGVFRGERFPHTLPRVRLGAMADTRRGTIRLGLHLMEKTSRQTLSVRWWAFRRSEETEEAQADERRIKVRITPDTVSLEPLGQVCLSARVEGDADQEVQWSVPSPNGGGIDPNGVYLAPAGEGVFEVVARSVKYADKTASAYIVVHETGEGQA